jgi:hypothetical protein
LSKVTCPMIARSDWGVGGVHQRGLAHTRSLGQSSIGFNGSQTGGWIVFLNGAHRGEDVRLTLGDLKIGSAWNSDIILTGVGIGSFHASIKIGLEEITITPSSDSRDVRIQNTSLKKTTVLADGDLVSFGDLHGIFRSAQPYTPGYKPKDYARPDSLPSQAAPTHMVCGWLIMQRGPLTGQDFRLINGVCRIGSAINIEVSIPDANIPAHVLTLKASPSKGCQIIHIADQKAAKVNGSVVEVGQPLRDSDVLSVDHMEMLVKWY